MSVNRDIDNTYQAGVGIGGLMVVGIIPITVVFGSIFILLYPFLSIAWLGVMCFIIPDPLYHLLGFTFYTGSMIALGFVPFYYSMKMMFKKMERSFHAFYTRIVGMALFGWSLLAIYLPSYLIWAIDTHKTREFLDTISNITKFPFVTHYSEFHHALNKVITMITPVF